MNTGKDSPKNIALVAPDDLSIWIYRKELIRQLQQKGTQVYVLAKETTLKKEIESLGAIFLPISFSRFVHPLADIRVLFQLYRICKRYRFEVFHSFTAKPNTFGVFAAYLAKVPIILSSVTGLGYLYTPPEESLSLTRKVMHFLYRLSGKIVHGVWFQNDEDKSYFLDHGFITEDKAVVIKSSGINTSEWNPQKIDHAKYQQQRKSWNVDEHTTVVLMVSRALVTKGTREFIQAANLVYQQNPKVLFVLAGGVEETNPDSISEEELLKASQQPGFTWIDHQSDVFSVIAASDICVLPSYYREGVPRNLLEAMAMEKPIVTTDNVGCKETVEQNINGYIVPVKNVEGLAAPILSLINEPELRSSMGKAGREKAVKEFSEVNVAKKLLQDLYQIESITEKSLAA